MKKFATRIGLQEVASSGTQMANDNFFSTFDCKPHALESLDICTLGLKKRREDVSVGKKYRTFYANVKKETYFSGKICTLELSRNEDSEYVVKTF